MNENKQYNRLLWNKRLFFWGRLLLGAIFILASVDKILHPAAFAKIIYNYQIVPDEAVNLTAIMLPWIELLLGLLLMLGLWIPGAVVLSNLLLLTFFGAILFNVARGLDINCGCFSTTGEVASGAPMGWYLLRDGIFLLLALYLFFYVFLRKRPTNRSAV
ncbi:MAG TPA: MauE/DoxX family redox-associated membrane protein [Acidobacteriota bacterium]|nr:MauE/DoxX family redox-associated membrane protein [Acidobacteriota bacterium]